MNHAGWHHRLAFYAFDYAHPGTVRFSVGEAGGGDPAVNAHRIMIEQSDKDFNHSGWTHRLSFYAYPDLPQLKRFDVYNQSESPIKVSVSKTLSKTGNDAWFTLQPGSKDTWKRLDWELVIIEFSDKDRRGFYLQPGKKIVIKGKDNVVLEEIVE